MSTSICPDKLLTGRTRRKTSSHDAAPGVRPGLRRGRAIAIAGAPISWGVCEVPGWGHQLTPTRCSRRCAISAWLPPSSGRWASSADEPAERAEQLAGYGLQAVGGFLPCSCTTPATTRCRRSTPTSTAVSPPAPTSSCSPPSPASRGTTTARCWTTTAGRRCSPTSTGSPTAPPSRGVVGQPSPARRHDGRDRRGDRAGARRLARRALRRHRPPRWSAAPTRSRSPRRIPTGSSTCTSRTSTARSPQQVVAGEWPSATPCRRACSVRWARATSTCGAWCGRSRPPATRGGTSWSRT